MTRRGQALIDWALAPQKPLSGSSWQGKCEEFARRAPDAPGGALYAINAWDASPEKYPASSGAVIPAATLVYWEPITASDKAARKNGHAAVSIGGGLCRSSSYGGAGTAIATVPIDVITQSRGGGLLGFIGTVNGTDFWDPTAPAPASAAPAVEPLDISTVIDAYYAGLKKRWINGPAVARAQTAVGAKPDGKYGPATARTVQAFEIVHHLTRDAGIFGPQCAAAAGIPTI